MKNLANCSGVEFLRQTNKIRHAVESWIKDTNVLEIRKHKPVLIPIKNEMTEEEKKETKAENEKRLKEQSKKNISDMLDSCLESHAEDTLKVLAMMCFLEPSEAESVKVTDLLSNFADMLGDEGVMRFFTSLMKWGVTNTSR